MAKHSVGVIGASGLVGKFLSTGFLEHGGYDVTLLTRKGGAGKLADFAANGAKVVEVDFGNQADLTAALQGLEMVVSAVGMEGLMGQADVIKAAQAAGVKRFVPSEFTGMDSAAPGLRESFPLVSYRFVTRDALEASGLEWTYVVNGFFLESIFTPFFFWDVDASKATLKGKTDTPFTVTSLVDIGCWLPQLLLDPASRNATVFLEGEEVTFDQAVEVFNKATGKQLEVVRRSTAELEADIAAAPSPFAAAADLLLRVIADGLAKVPSDKKWNKDGPTATIAKYFAV